MLLSPFKFLWLFFKGERAILWYNFLQAANTKRELKTYRTASIFQFCDCS